jgi:hypothetical protein
MKRTDTGRRLGAAGLLLLRVALSGALTTPAAAQTAPNWATGYVPSATEWISRFGGKADVANGVLTNPTVTGGTLNGSALTTPTIAGGALSGTFSGTHAYSGDTTFGGTTTFGNGAPNTGYWTVSGAPSGSPVIAAVGSGNVFAEIQGLGNFGPLMRSSTGGNITEFASSGTVGNFLIVTAEPLGSPVQISTSDNTLHEGLQFQSYTGVSHNFVYSGTTGAPNQNTAAISSISGLSADVGAYGINFDATTLSLQTSASILTRSIQQTNTTGFYGPSNTLFVGESENGAQGSLAVWALNTAYGSVGQTVQSGPNAYALVTAGTSLTTEISFSGYIVGTSLTVTSGGTGLGIGDTIQFGGDYVATITGGTTSPFTVTPSQTLGSSGSPVALVVDGPSGTASSIQDGSAIWRYITPADLLYYHTTLAAEDNVSYNVGGTSSAYRGTFFGGGIGVYAQCPAAPPNCATYLTGITGLEVDAYMATGTSAVRRSVIQAVGGSNGGQASFEDWGIVIVSTKTAGAGLLNPLIFTNNDSNSYGIDFWDQSSGGLQPMAGAIDLMRVNANGSGPSGGGFLMRWANGALTNATGQYAGGVLQLGAASLAPSSSGLTIDAPLYSVSSMVPASGPATGTNWSVNEWATDKYGDWGLVTSVSAGAVTGFTLSCSGCVIGQQPTSALPSGYGSGVAVQWYPDNASLITDGGGSHVVSTPFTATNTWAQSIATPTITLGGVSTVTIGNANSGGTAAKYVCATSGNVIVVQAAPC